jgi:predicted nucleic acid-binding protein
MVYLDTNILIYATIEQDIEKKEKSLDIIEDLVNRDNLILSPLVMQEYIFTLSKLKIKKDIIEHDTAFYFNFVSENYTKEMLEDALNLCLVEKNCKNINDILHAKLASKYATKLLTYDSDFKKLQKYIDIEIEIL